MTDAQRKRNLVDYDLISTQSGKILVHAHPYSELDFFTIAVPIQRKLDAPAFLAQSDGVVVTQK